MCENNNQDTVADKDIEKDSEPTEHEQFKELCEYVFLNIMGYKKEEIKFPKFMALRLRGLRDGKFMGNTSTPIQANYTFNLILITFKAKRLDILLSFAKKEFTDEQHKFNYAMAIIENSINDIYLRMKKTKENNDKVINIQIDDLILPDTSTDFTLQQPSKQSTPLSNSAKRFSNLW